MTKEQKKIIKDIITLEQKLTTTAPNSECSKLQEILDDTTQSVNLINDRIRISNAYTQYEQEEEEIKFQTEVTDYINNLNKYLDNIYKYLLKQNYTKQLSPYDQNKIIKYNILVTPEKTPNELDKFLLCQNCKYKEIKGINFKDGNKTIVLTTIGIPKQRDILYYIQNCDTKYSLTIGNLKFQMYNSQIKNIMYNTMQMFIIDENKKCFIKSNDETFSSMNNTLLMSILVNTYNKNNPTQNNQNTYEVETIISENELLVIKHQYIENLNLSK